MTTTKDKHYDEQIAGIYRALALRFYARYVDMREAAEHHGVDLADHGPLQTEVEADDRYAAAIGDWLISPPESAKCALAMVHFAGVLAADRLIGEVTQQPVNDERDAYHQSIALANVALWLNDRAINEYMDRERESRRYESAIRRAIDEAVPTEGQS
jgi:hypothetical protein